MAGRIGHLRHEFVRYIPADLADGVLYVSIEYKVAVHRCCCGCGEKVVTPLSPAGWEVTFDGASVSLWPSIAGGACNSHYIIRRCDVIWAGSLSRRQVAAAAQRDMATAEAWYASPGAAGESDTPARSRWRRWLSRLRLR
jgi:hypothetical protein